MHACVQAQAFERVLHRERVHHGGEHAHVVAGDAVHAGAREARAAEDVAAADDDGDLHAHRVDLADLAGDALEHRRVDAVVRDAHQGFAAQLHQDAPVARCVLGHSCVAGRQQDPASVGTAGQCFDVRPLPCTCAITSATKSSCFFSMPAPTSKRSKRRTLRLAALQQLLDRDLVVLHEGLADERRSRRGTCAACPRPSSATISAGLPSARRVLLGEDLALLGDRVGRDVAAA